MLIVYHNENYIQERKYIFHVIFSEFLGVQYQTVIEHRTNICIRNLEDPIEKKLEISDFMFQHERELWLTKNILPKQPLARWSKIGTPLSDLPIPNTIPIIYGKRIRDASYIEYKDDTIQLGIDIFGAAFFMLTCYEEYVKHNRDEHNRFLTSAAISFQEGFLTRPIINEYLEILWGCIHILWPLIMRKKRVFKTYVSLDVDKPFAQVFSNYWQFVRNCVGDIYMRKSFLRVIERIKSLGAINKGDYKKDLNYTFDTIMDINESLSMKSVFYFKTGRTNKQFDDNYSVDHPYLIQLLQSVNRRGHEIGLHPSYETYNNQEQIVAEFNKLLKVCEEVGIVQEKWGGRQHYLRFLPPITWRFLNEAGLNYDSTLAFEDYAGFRCGVCYTFSVYDLQMRKHLPLVEHPLILMESTIIGQGSLEGLKLDAKNQIINLKNECEKYAGDFRVLWHNSCFYSNDHWTLYREIINDEKKRNIQDTYMYE